MKLYYPTRFLTMTLILQLQIALLVALALLVGCAVQIFIQRKALQQHQNSVELLKKSISQYHQSVEMLKKIVNDHESLLKEHGIDLPEKSQVPPVSEALPLPDLRSMKKQFVQPKVSRGNRVYKDIVKLLNGDTATADNLISHQQQVNPSKPEKWILEKVLEDLKRDRRI